MRSIVGLLLVYGFAINAYGAGLTLRELHAKDEEGLKKAIPALFNSDPVDYALIDEAIRWLMERGTYENVFAEQAPNGALLLTGKPIRTVETVEFRGVKKVEEAELRELLDFKLGDRFDRKRAVAAGEKMKTYYGEHGFFNTVIELSFNKTANKNLHIIYEIQEKNPCVITGLEFQTQNTDLKAKLESYFRDLKRRPLTTERARKLNADLSEFLIYERYLAAEVLGPTATYNADKTQAYLKFEVREPWRFEFYMSGFQRFTLTDLYHALDLRNKERKNVDPASEGAERIRSRYLEKGFPNVSIDTKIVNPKDTYLKRIYYAINEGPRVRIRGIEVQGRISRSSQYYEDFILANSSELIHRGYYNRLDLENGAKNLVTDLRNQGFLRARVLSSRIEFNDARDQVVIFLTLEEGPQTEIRALEFQGNHFFSGFELAEITGLETNSPLHLNHFEESLEKLKVFYRNQGFLEMRLLNEKDDLIQFNEKGTQARILFRIYEGPRIRIRNILVEGNQLTKTSVILKEADFQIGEILTPQQIEESIARLNKLGLFSRADIHTSDENTNVAERTLVISVTERDPGILRFGAGVTNERNLTVRGFAGSSYANLWGTARAISLRGEVKQNVAQIKYPEHEVTGGYLEPFLFNTRTRGRVNLTRSEHVFEYQSEKTVTKLTTTNRIDFLAERDLSLHTKLTWKVWSMESNKDWERYGRCLFDPDNPDAAYTFDPNRYCGPDVQQIASIGPTLDIDYRDSAFLPTRGTRWLLVTSYADPNLGSSAGIKFIRSELNLSRYDQISRTKVVWANSFRSGYVSNLSNDPGSGVPTSYAFLLGGIYTVRGFDLASDDERIPKQNNDDFVVKSGNRRLFYTDSYYYLIKTEFRFPVYGDHGAVIFYDGALVGISGYHFYRPYRDAIGFGYRFNTPVGPLAMDLAFKISPESNESPFRFHLSIGTF